MAGKILDDELRRCATGRTNRLAFCQVMRTVAPISAVIVTRNRAASFARTLDSLLSQDLLPAEFVVVDASDDDATRRKLAEFVHRIRSDIPMRWLKADTAGAAVQRNQGVAAATQPFIWFLDDDVLFEPSCARRLWNAIESDRQVGGVNAMIMNQRYQSPGFVSRAMFTLMHGQSEKSFAGKVIGPAINLLPEDRDDLPEVVPVEWLNTTCTIYRREALPSPPFDVFFTEYSIMEDLALSLRVGKEWHLANARTARIYHESQSNMRGHDAYELAKMESVNRYYVMRNVMEKRRFSDVVRLIVWEIFLITSSLVSRSGVRNFPKVLTGRIRAFSILRKSLT